MEEKQDLPVCTLFNQPDAQPVDNIFLDVSVSTKPETPVVDTEAIDTTKQPAVCDLFQSVSSADDLFAEISNAAVSENDDSTMKQASDNHQLVEENVTHQPETKNDDLNNSTVCLHDTELPDIFDSAMSLVDNNTKENQHDTSTVDVNTGLMKGDSSADVLKQADLMTSIIINDQSLDVSNVSEIQSVELTETVENVAGAPNSNSETELSDITNAKTDEMEFKTESQEPINVIADDTPNNYTSSTGLSVNISAENSVCTPSAMPSNVDNGSESLSAEMFEAPSHLASTLFAPSNENSLFDTIGTESASLQTEDDAFTSALHTSETDRRRDAWIPGQSTKTVLAAVAQSQQRIKLERRYLTMPGLATSESLGDPVKAVLARYKGIESASQRRTLTADSVSRDKNGLQRLINSGNLRAAVDLCGLVLTDLGQGFGMATQESSNTSLTLQWWQARLSLLLQLKLYDIATTEFQQFGSFDAADLYYGFYPDLYPGRRGSMVPFSLRLLHADFLRHLSKPNEALAQLYSMKSACQQIITNLESGLTEDGTAVELKPDDKEASLRLWNKRKTRVMYCIGNTLVQVREYLGAIKIFDEIVEASSDEAVFLLSGIGRMLLQLGDVKAAQRKFAQAERVAGNDSRFKVQLISNRGFLYLGANNWKEALGQFNDALKIEPDNLEALNNKAVCLLYLCRLKEAISVQEIALKLQDGTELPHLNEYTELNTVSHEGAVSNLVTLYELESSRSMNKKQALLHHIALTGGDGFNVACLKM